MAAVLTEEKIKEWVKEGVREAIQSEFIKWRATLLPAVSAQEQKEIEKIYKKLSHKPAKTIKIQLWPNGK